MTVRSEVDLWKPEKLTPVDPKPADTPRTGETRVRFSGMERHSVLTGGQAGAMSTETFMVEFLASVKITPLTGGTSP